MKKLTEQEIITLRRATGADFSRPFGDSINFARAIEAEVLRINGLTAEAAEQLERGQAHIGWMARNRSGKLDMLTDLEIAASNGEWEGIFKLYAVPPTPPAGVPDDAIKDAEKRGYLEALHNLAFRAANHWHGIPSIDASMKIERNVVMAWCEEAEKEFDAAMLSAAPQPAAQT